MKPYLDSIICTYFSKRIMKHSNRWRKTMEATIHVQKMRVHHRRNLSHSRAEKYGISSHSSLSISHIRKRSLSRHHQSLPIQVGFLSFFVWYFLKKIVWILFQHFVVKDAQSNDIIHTTIQIAGNNINPIKKKLSTQNIHLQSVRSFEILIIVLYIFFWNLKQVASNLIVCHIHKASEKFINHQKSVKLVKNKIEPINVVENYRHDQVLQKVTLIYDWTRKSNLSVYSSDLTIAYSYHDSIFWYLSFFTRYKVKRL
jgi:hypothetical protein